MANSEKARLIQLVKIGQRQLAIADEEYRLMLKRLTGKESATKCTVVDLHKVIYELQQKGAKITWFARKPMKTTAYSPTTGSQKVKTSIAHKIRAIWINMGKDGLLKDSSEKALNAFVRKIVNQHRSILVLNVASLVQSDASHILEILKKWHKRVLIERLEAQTGEKIQKKASYETVINYYNEVFNETM